MILLPEFITHERLSAQLKTGAFICWRKRSCGNTSGRIAVFTFFVPLNIQFLLLISLYGNITFQGLLGR